MLTDRSQLAHGMNAAVLVSAWSAAVSDLYVSSRFLFFLSFSGHAPRVFGRLISYPVSQEPNVDRMPESDTEDEDSADVLAWDALLHATAPPDGAHSFADRVPNSVPVLEEFDTGASATPPSHTTATSSYVCAAPPTPVRNRSLDVEATTNPGTTQPRQPWYVVPLFAVLASASMGSLCFMGSKRGAAPEVAFTWLVAVASVASLQSWAAMLFTYIR